MSEAELPPAFYLPIRPGRYLATEATASPWDLERSQHGGPPSALLASAIEAEAGSPELRLAQIVVDFLRPIPRGEVEVSVRPIRPGRRIRQTEATLSAGGEPAVRARAWHLAAGPHKVAAPEHEDPPPPLPASQEQRYFPGLGPWGYGRAVEWRFVAGSFELTGPAEVWTRVRIPLVAGRPLTGLERLLIVADSANGISGELTRGDWLFVPTSITVTLRRHPGSEWTFMAARSHVAGDGIGVCEASVADLRGHLGVVVQPLLVAPAG